MADPLKKSRKSAPKKRRKANGRPAIKIDIDELGKLAGLQCTQADAAAWFGCSPDTIKRRLREAKYRDAWEMGLGKGRVSLRRKQMNLADRNATMAIFLGKQYLGQKDVTEHEMSGELKISHIERIFVEPDAFQSAGKNTNGAGLPAPTDGSPV